MYQLLSDNPQAKDRLGFQPMADILVDVTEQTEPPFTIGIFGEWGSGKTTLMTLVRRQLEDRNAKTVWFNAWKYDGKEVIWNALIQTIFLQ
jgi:predicted KAP-like P-loop ATPase